MWALFLVWLFFGVAVISDKFVEAIEVITSKEHLVERKTKDGGVVMVKEPIWNCELHSSPSLPSPFDTQPL